MILRSAILRATVAVSCAAACGTAFAQQTPQFHSGTSSVLVEAVVTGKKGDVPGDLAVKDFRLWQDGKEQAITSLSFQPKSGNPHFLVIFLDGAQIAAGDKARAFQDLSRFIDASSAPGRQIGIVSFDGELRAVQGFTDDAGTLKDALRRLGPAGATSNVPHNAAAGPGDSFSSRNMLNALGNLSKSLGVLPGRKTIVLLTGGFPFTADLKSSADAAVEESSKADVAIYPVDVQPIAVARSAPAAGQTRPQMARRGDSPRGLQGPDDAPSLSQDPEESSLPILVTLANKTGGFVTPTSDDLLAQLQRIGEEQTEYYVLSYTPPEAEEGTCHSLRVKVDRAGATVRARSSYCAVKPPDLTTAAPAMEDLEKRTAGSDSGNLKAAIALPYFYVSAGVARVHVAVELSPAGLKFENVKGKLHAEINFLGIASASDSTVAARFSDTLKFDFDGPADVEKFQQSPIHYEKELKVAPGAYNFVLACSSGPESFAKLDVPLVIDPWNTADLALSSIVLSRQTHPAADLGSIAALIQDQTPLVAQGTEFVPTGSSKFSRDGEGFFYLELYSPDPGSATVRVRVLSQATGAPQWDSGITKLPPPEGARKTSVSAGARLPLHSLQPGSYRLEITASDSSGKQVQRISNFEVN
jgi:VWFA-related protein